MPVRLVLPAQAGFSAGGIRLGDK